MPGASPKVGLRKENMTVRKDSVAILEIARNAILTYGWVQGYYGRKEDGFCLDGALRYATTGEAFAPPGFGTQERGSYKEAGAILWELIKPSRRISMTHWNDAASRTKTEVLDILKRAIDIARSGGLNAR